MALTREDLAEQAKQTARAYFLGLKDVAGIPLSEFEEDLILRKSLIGHSKHVIRHQLKQHTIDSYKLIGFLAFNTCITVWDRGGKDEAEIPTICSYSVDRLAAPLRRDTSARVILSVKDKKYIGSMLEAEICNAEHAGIGANGIGAMFQFMRKAFDYTDKWDITEARI